MQNRTSRKKIKDLCIEIAQLRKDLNIQEGSLFYKLYHLIKKNDQETEKERYHRVKNKDVYQMYLTYQQKLLKVKYSPIYTGIKKILSFLFVLQQISNNLTKRTLTMRVLFLRKKEKDNAHLNIINFGTLPYYYRKLRQQHLVEELDKKGHTIFYIENNFTRKNSNSKPSFDIKHHFHNIYIISLWSINNISIYTDKPTNEEMRYIVNSCNNIIKTLKLNNIVIKIDHPFWYFIAEHLPYPILYDCMDDYEGFDITTPVILKIEKELFKNAHKVITCSHGLLNKIKQYVPQEVSLIPNACDFNHFNQVVKGKLTIPPDLVNINQPIIGFFGGLGEWIDICLIEKIAKSFPQAHLIIIGDMSNASIRYLSYTHAYKNIILLGEKPYNTLPHYLQKFDVCIIPFLVNKSTVMIDPVKLYEYCAAGKPAVVTNLTEITRCSKFCYVSHSHTEFLENIQIALNENDSRIKQQRIDMAQNNTWSKRAQMLNQDLLKIASSRSK